MDPARTAKLLALFAILGLCSCQHLEPPSEKEKLPATSEALRPANLQQHIRNNSASLLYGLLNDEKNVSKLLIVKHESDALDALVNDISASAAAAAKRLEQLQAADRSLYLKEIGLPSGEVMTREAVAKARTRELLDAKGVDFEFKLLLTQLEALNYGRHLADVAAGNEPRPDQARVFADVGAELKRLHDRALALVKAH